MSNESSVNPASGGKGSKKRKTPKRKGPSSASRVFTGIVQVEVVAKTVAAALRRVKQLKGFKLDETVSPVPMEPSGSWIFTGMAFGVRDLPSGIKVWPVGSPQDRHG